MSKQQYIINMVNGGRILQHAEKRKLKCVTNIMAGQIGYMMEIKFIDDRDGWRDRKYFTKDINELPDAWFGVVEFISKMQDCEFTIQLISHNGQGVLNIQSSDGLKRYDLYTMNNKVVISK